IAEVGDGLAGAGQVVEVPACHRLPDLQVDPGVLLGHPGARCGLPVRAYRPTGTRFRPTGFWLPLGPVLALWHAPKIPEGRGRRSGEVARHPEVAVRGSHRLGIKTVLGRRLSRAGSGLCAASATGPPRPRGPRRRRWPTRSGNRTAG